MLYKKHNFWVVSTLHIIFTYGNIKNNKNIFGIAYMYIICKGKTFIWNSKIASIIINHINKKEKESNWHIVKLDLISVQFHCLYGNIIQMRKTCKDYDSHMWVPMWLSIYFCSQRLVWVDLQTSSCSVNEKFMERESTYSLW